MRTLAAFLAIVLAGGAVAEAQPLVADAESHGSPWSWGHSASTASLGLAEPVRDFADPTPTGAIGTVLLGGYATWYETPGLTAAAGPVLRDVLGDWRGQWITVEAGPSCVPSPERQCSVEVRLTDFCACGERHGTPTLLDLSDAAFSELAPLSAGVIRVAVEIDPPEHEADDRMRQEDAGPTLPPTDSEEDPA